MTPVHAALNPGELNFIDDLRAFFDRRPDLFAGKELHLLRNLPKIGVGFAESGNFYPDFLLWLLDGAHQHLAFIDPKGIVHSWGFDNPKIQLYRVIKDIERQLADPSVSLHSFIVTPTPHADVASWGADRAKFRDHHVLFQHDEKATYIETMFNLLLAGVTVP